MLQAVEEAYFILYELSATVNYRSSSELNGLQEHLERWLIKAEHINKFFCKLKPIVNYDFICLLRHMNDIFYYCCIPDHGKSTKEENNRQQIFNNEIANATGQVEVIYQLLTDFIRNYLTKECHGDDVQFFLEKNLKEKRRKKYEKNNDSG